MQTPAPPVISVLLIGTLVMGLLLAFIFLLVVLHQRRMIAYQVELRTLHAARQQDLFQAVFEAQESERQRLAADLHDSVGQVLSVIKFNLHRLQRLQEPAGEFATPTQVLLTQTSGLAEDCMREIRHIVRNILPPLLTDFGLVEALRHLAAQVEHATGMPVVFEAETGLERPAREVEVGLYRVVQELFTNALKHSQASAIEFNIAQQAGWLVLTFADNGIGFRPERVKPGGLGLKNLESRVALLQGELRVGPGPAGGTRAQIRVRTPGADSGL